MGRYREGRGKCKEREGTGERGERGRGVLCPSETEVCMLRHCAMWYSFAPLIVVLRIDFREVSFGEDLFISLRNGAS